VASWPVIYHGRRGREPEPAPALRRESLGAVRARANAPRVLTLGAIGVLALAGVRHIIAPPAPVTVSRTVQVPASGDAAPADAFAQDFARAFLTFDGSDTSGHDQQLAGFLAPGVDLSQTVVPSGGRGQHVTWTTIAGRVSRGSGQSTITVEVGVDRDATPRYLAVAVRQGQGGTVAVTGLPALVNAPALDTESAPSAGDQVSDPALVAVVERALGSYLRGDSAQLAADLLPGAAQPVPANHLALTQTTAVTQVSAGLLAAEVNAHDAAGVSYSLRYLIAVSRRDRWYVAAINPPAPRRQP